MADTPGLYRPLLLLFTVLTISAMALVAAAVAASFSSLPRRPLPASPVVSTVTRTPCRILSAPPLVKPAYTRPRTSSPKLPARNPAPTALPPIFPSPIPPLLLWSYPVAPSPTPRSSPTMVLSMPSMPFSRKTFLLTPRSPPSLLPPAGAAPTQQALFPAPQPLASSPSTPQVSPSPLQLLPPRPAARRSWMSPTSLRAPPTPISPTTPLSPSSPSAARVLRILPLPTPLHSPLSLHAPLSHSPVSSPIKDPPPPLAPFSPRPFPLTLPFSPSPIRPAGAALPSRITARPLPSALTLLPSRPIPPPLSHLPS